MIWLGVGAIFGFFAVAFGAFGAHVIKARVAADLFEVYKTGAIYHLAHAIVLCVVGTVISHPSLATETARTLRLSAWSFALGMTIFSGSLYLLVLSGQRWIGAITPIGGTVLLVGWGALAWAALR